MNNPLIRNNEPISPLNRPLKRMDDHSGTPSFADTFKSTIERIDQTLPGQEKSPADFKGIENSFDPEW
jgi:hypothetical protein